MEQFGPQKDWQSFCRGMVPYGMHPEKDIVMGRAPGHKWEPTRKYIGGTEKRLTYIFAVHMALKM